MKRVYIFDLIGIHCGLHYYTDAFYNLLSREQQLDVRLLVNYSQQGQRPFFSNIFVKNKIKAGLLLLQCFLKLFFLAAKERRSTFILTSYGQKTDLLFFFCALINRNIVIDVHEVFAKEHSHRDYAGKLRELYYRHAVHSVVYHAAKTLELLHTIGYCGKSFYVPHFKYTFAKQYDESKLGDEIKNAVVPDKINLLFFGNITRVKGIDLLKEAILSLPEDVAQKWNVIIAGRIRDDGYDAVLNRENCYRLILRKIEDDELVYLYSHTDYVALPYRETYQSGVLEAAFHFKKPVLMTSIAYFEEVFARCPSMGFLCGTTPAEFAAVLTALTQLPSQTTFFRPQDVDAFEGKEEFDAFVKQFCDAIP